MYAHAMIAQLSWDVQNIVAILLPENNPQHTGFSFEFES